MDLQTAAVAAEQRGRAVLLQQRVGGRRGAVLLAEGEADLWDQGLGPRTRPPGVFGRRRLIGRVLGNGAGGVVPSVFSLWRDNRSFECFSTQTGKTEETQVQILRPESRMLIFADFHPVPFTAYIVVHVKMNTEMFYIQ